MLCYRFLMSQKMSASSSTAYLKLYDAEIVPLLLRRPAQHLYSTLQCTSVASVANKNNSRSVQRQEQDFIRSSRHLFHTSSFPLAKAQAKTQEVLSTTPPPPPPLSPNDDISKPTTTKTSSDDQSLTPKETIPETTTTTTTAPVPLEELEKLGLFARFKKMYKEYWYVLLPVHVVTSCGWLGGFYYLSKSGFDVASLMESWHFNEMIVTHLRDSKLGHVAIGYFLYKCFTPIRYMVTLGCSTYTIKKLSILGYIRPMPTKDALMKMYQDKKDARQKKMQGGSNNF